MGFSRKKHLFETEPEYVVKYLDMLKQEKYWSNNGQYYMARECGRRAKCLEQENKGGYESYLKTEELYCMTKKLKFDTYDRSGVASQNTSRDNRYQNNRHQNNRHQDNRYQNNRHQNNRYQNNRHQGGSADSKMIGRSDEGNWR